MTIQGGMIKQRVEISSAVRTSDQFAVKEISFGYSVDKLLDGPI